MGKQISKFSQQICAKPSYYKVLILGLEGSGKTNVFDRIKSNEVLVRHPTIGFNAEQIKMDNMMVTLWDFGGHEKIMNLWERYFDQTDLVILVIDSTDVNSLDKVKIILDMLKSKLSDVYVMVILNKIDLKESLPLEDIVKATSLYAYGLKIAKIIRTSTVRGDGMREVTRTMLSVLRNYINYIGKSLIRLARKIKSRSAHIYSGKLGVYYEGGFEERMSRREAQLILGVTNSTSDSEIKERYKQLMILNHPDSGGSTYLATKINQAKGILI